MRHLSVTAVAVAQLLSLPLQADENAEFKEYKALWGEWELIGAESGDKKLNYGRLTAKFSGPKLDFVFQDRAAVSQFFVSVDPAASPKAMNVTRRDETGAQPKILGIYKIEDDVLTFVLYTHDDEAMRPRSFEMSRYKRGTKYTFKRIPRSGN